MALTFIVTNAGRAALVNAANTGTAPVVIAQVGISATAVAPTPATAALPGEFKRLTTLSGDVVADDTIHLIVRDESNDVFTVRSVALYLGDGTLFGIYGQAAVLVEKSAQAMMLLGIDVRFEDIAATNITFGDANFLNPPATTEQIGVVELATTAEAQAGIDALRALTPASARAAILGWLLAQDGAGSGVDSDMLDGQHGSFYADIPGRLGYTPANRAGDVFTGAIKRDADYGLDYFGGGTSQPALLLNGTASYFSFGRTEKQFYAVIDNTVRFMINGAGAQIGGSTVWHAGNDGAGSGLDAGLLAGQGPSYYTDIVARLGYTPANKAGDVFTGPIKRDANFGLDYFGSTDQPALLMNGTTSYFSYDRPGKQFYAVIDGSVRFMINGSNAQVNGNTVWHAGNDGAGSGLDAGLLAGQGPSYYTDIVARLGYTPANKAGDVFTGAIKRDANFGLDYFGGSEQPALMMNGGVSYFSFGRTEKQYYAVIDNTVRFMISAADSFVSGNKVWHAGNDGAGSGLDAGLLAGQSPSYYTDIVARLGYTPANKAGDTFNGAIKRDANFGLDFFASSDQPALMMNGGVSYFSFGRTQKQFYAVIDNTVRFMITATDSFVSGNKVWHAGNDGAGSGMDADLLDGFDASAFLRDVGNSLTQNGYVRLSNGLILQWGSIAGTWSANVDISGTYPIAFPTAVLGIVGANSDVAAQKDAVVGFNYTPAPTVTGFKFRTNFAGQNRLNWFAIGY